MAVLKLDPAEQFIDILAPQRIGYTLITTLPLSLIAFAAAFGGWIALDRKEGARFTLRVPLTPAGTIVS